jgi:hypothetical protein
VQHKLNSAGHVEKQTLRHTVLLSGVYGDTPAQQKLTCFLGHSAYLGHGHCCMRATRVGNTMLWLGYAEPTYFGYFATGARCGSRTLQLSVVRLSTR